jgi:hypothetical protein
MLSERSSSRPQWRWALQSLDCTSEVGPAHQLTAVPLLVARSSQKHSKMVSMAKRYTLKNVSATTNASTRTRMMGMKMLLTSSSPPGQAKGKMMDSAQTVRPACTARRPTPSIHTRHTTPIRRAFTQRLHTHRLPTPPSHNAKTSRLRTRKMELERERERRGGGVEGRPPCL